MKKIHEHIEKWSRAIDHRWKSMAPKSQRRYVVIFSALYLIITIGVMAFAWNEGRKNNPPNPDTIRHIGNPVLNQKKSGNVSDYGRTE